MANETTDNKPQTPQQAAAQVPVSKPTPQQPEEKKGFTNQEIQTIEANRQDPKSWNVIHLLRDGNYWHANEWSDWLLSLVPRIQKFLKEELSLELHLGKVRISEAHQGVEFLGAFIRPYRIYLSNATLERIREHLQEMDFSDKDKVVRSVNSYFGIMAHTASYRLRMELFYRPEFLRIGWFDPKMTKMTRHK